MIDKSKKDIEIRLLLEQDADVFWKLRLRALKEEPESFGAAYEESQNKSFADIKKQLNSSDDSFVFGAFLSSHLVGMIGFYRRTGLKMLHTGNIWGMYVIPESQGNGIGKELLLALIARASSINGLEQLVLSVVSTNQNARRLYQSLGFSAYGIEPRTLKLADRYLDEELMMLKL